MDMRKNRAHLPESEHRTFTKKPIVDWSEDKIIVNGHPIIVTFPDETKPLSNN